MSQVNNANRKAYLVGGGIASLSAAVFLIQDGHVPGQNIHILEESHITGGSLDGAGNAESGFVIRGGRMFDEEQYQATYNLLARVPALNDPTITAYDEMRAFNREIKTNAQARLIDKDGNKVDVTHMGFDNADRLALAKLMAVGEKSLGTARIEDVFPPHFFETNFWYMWATTFAFQPWHSAIEFKRYLHIFIHEFPKIDTLAGVRRTALNQYDSIVLPVATWLRAQGAVFELGTQVTDLDIAYTPGAKTVQRIHLLRNGEPISYTIGPDDLVIVTNGSMTAGATLGSMHSAPQTLGKDVGGSWALWETLATNHPEFGNPASFDSNVEQSLWESFTVTCGPENRFVKMMQEFSGNAPGTGALVTFKDSNWLMSIVIARQPHFRNQPDDVTIFWGYGLFPDREGNVVKKKMRDCTGAEILEELLYHLKFSDYLPEMLRTANCIPVMMPFITSQFMPRAIEDRPQVVPEGYTNLAFVGQFVEIPEGVVFTVDYSVKTAMIAVYTLLGIDREIPPYYKGEHDVRVLFNSLVTMYR